MPDYQNETLDKIKQLCKDNEDELGKLGAAQESAQGTANIAERVLEVVEISDSVNTSLQDANGIVARLNLATGKFRL